MVVEFRQTVALGAQDVLDQLDLPAMSWADRTKDPQKAWHDPF